MNSKITSSFKYAAVILMGLMALTRFNHFGTQFSLPDATLAVFFLGSFLVGGRYLFIALLIEAGLIDYIAITQFSVSDFCISPAYVFLIPTYGVMWVAGHYASALKSLNSIEFFKSVGLQLIAASLAFVISNGSFYVLSDKMNTLSILDYVTRVEQYYYPYVGSTLFYGVFGLVIIKLLKLFPAILPHHKSV